MKSVLLGIVLLAAVTVTPCYAGGLLSIRLVESTKGGDGQNAAGLEDVVDILNRSLASANYRLVDTCTVQLPANSEATIGAYTLKCSGTQKNLVVTVLRHGKEVVKTANIPLQAGKPFILGGFREKNSVLLLVFMVK